MSGRTRIVLIGAAGAAATAGLLAAAEAAVARFSRELARIELAESFEEAIGQWLPARSFEEHPW